MLRSGGGWGFKGRAKAEEIATGTITTLLPGAQWELICRNAVRIPYHCQRGRRLPSRKLSCRISTSASNMLVPVSMGITLGEILSGLNFTVIDVETANSQRGSVCAVGMTQVRNGEITRACEWHVQPPTGLDSFDPRNIAIHGITPDMVKNANSWQDSLEAIETLAEGFPLVAYNAAFDKSAIMEASRLSSIVPPANDFHCALVLAKRLMKMEKYALPLVAAELGADPFDHHSAGADSAACAQVVLALAKQHGLTDLAMLWPAAEPKNDATPLLKATVFSRGHRSAIADLPQPDMTADSSHPFYGRQVIMTGDLESLDRWEAMERIAAVGGANGKGVTKKTGFLVVGEGKDYDAIDLENGTTKERKAAAYMAAGQDITVLTETDFLKLVRADRLESAVASLEVVKAEADGTGGVLLAEAPVAAPSSTAVAPGSWDNRSDADADSDDAVTALNLREEPSARSEASVSEPQPVDPEKTSSSRDEGFWRRLARLFGAGRK